MEKRDYKKSLKYLYKPSQKEPVVITVPKMQFLMIDGHGDPNTSQEYIDAIEALYPLAYTIKFTSKLQQGIDFGVMPLEGLWWTDDMRTFSSTDKSDWQWTAMIMQPDCVTEELFEQALEQVARKKNPAALQKVRYESYVEGRAAQIMYLGPYSEEGPTIQRLHDFIEANGGELTSATKHHHEIYLSDPRRTAPSKLKTIIRQPF